MRMMMAMKTNEMDKDELLMMKYRRKKMFMTILPFAGLAVTLIILTILTKGLLLSSGNVVNIMNQSFTLALVGIGISFVYSWGGMDFSIGPACGVAQLVCYAVVVKMGYSVLTGALAAIAVGIIATMIVGLATNYLHLQAFIVSLCVRSACAGIQVVGCNSLGRNVQVPYATFTAFSNNIIKIIVLIIFIVVGWYLFEKTSLGKEQKAIGGNPVTSVQSGIQLRKNVLLGHLLLGLSVGIASCFQMVRAGTITSQSGSVMEFNIMIALTLGGFPMAGGSTARIRSTIVGVLIITILTNGLTILGVDSTYINMIKGLLFILIVAISFDRSNLKQVSFT